MSNSLKSKRNLAMFPRIAYPEEEYQYLGREGLELVNKLINRYDWYDGKHWKDDAGIELTPADLKVNNNLDYVPTMLTVNLIAWFIDRLAAFMFERPIGLSCPAEQVDDSEVILKPEYKPSAEQQKANEKAASREYLLYRIIKQNLLHEKLIKAASDYHIGSGVCAKLHYDPQRGMRIIWRPRLEYWPIYHQDDVDVLEKIHFVAWIDDNTIWKQTYEMKDDSCWMEEGLYDVQLKLKKWIVPPTNLELPFLPIEIFTRGGLTGETEGRSLVDTLAGMNHEVNKKISDNGDSLRMGMFAIKVILNAMVPTEEEVKVGEAKPLQIAPNALWTLQGDGDLQADAKVLEHKFEYKEVLKEHLETILALMHKLAEVPNIDPDQVKGLGQMSGFAIRLLYGAILSATNRSMMIWKPRLNRLFGKALYMLNKYDTKNHYDQSWINDAGLEEIIPGNLDDIVEVKTEVPLPANEAEAIDLEIKKVAAMLQSIKGAMDALGIENPEKLIAEIMQEKLTIRQAFGDFLDQDGEGGSGGDSRNSGAGEE